MIDALMLGCMFVKIPRAETLVFSCVCFIADCNDQPYLLFRIGHLRDSHMVDAKSEIDLGYESGSDRLFLVEPQVIQHSIDPSSPLWELGPDQLWRQQFQIIAILEDLGPEFWVYDWNYENFRI
ncbi:hypothetical protein AAFF_G00168450 [Aldrovandia affinis]|uniref:Inward rectifier potassium channel C-terminal domain-containing protein n=1 Tax=Aldrovandia affinis TaxID=143900 RepID=A0AAD7RM48_9TELE|nr:hypothetical protein AAFF_G00168450 [Aldrovandia affinis]